MLTSQFSAAAEPKHSAAAAAGGRITEENTAKQEGTAHQDPPADHHDNSSGREGGNSSTRSSHVRSSTSSRSSRSASFFRSLLRNQNFDYHAESPSAAQASSNSIRARFSRASFFRKRQLAVPNIAGADAVNRNPSEPVTGATGDSPTGEPARTNTDPDDPFRPQGEDTTVSSRFKAAVHHSCLSLIKSVYWKVILIFFTLFLLFGAEIRDIFLPKTMDTAIDIIFSIALVFFTIDILVRVIAETNYFHWRFRDEYTGHWRPTIGSFLFFCEAVATVAILYEISYINPKEVNEYYIVLDIFGIPLGDGLKRINEASPVERDVALIVTIAKTLRVARFIRSSAALKLSTKLNLYRVLDCLSTCTSREAQSSSSAQQGDVPGSLSTQIRQEQIRSSLFSNRSSVSSDSVGKRALTSTPMLPLFGSARLKRGEGSQRHIRSRNHEAASKIQRAWRKSTHSRSLQMKHPLDDISDYEGDKKRSSFRYNTASQDQAKREREAAAKKRNESQVGSAMRELTGERVALGIIITFVFAIIFSYKEIDATRPSTMMVLHNQTSYPPFASLALDAARSSSVPDLFWYEDVFGNITEFELNDEQYTKLRESEIVRISIQDTEARSSVGLFSFRNEKREAAVVMLLSTIFIILVWFFGVTAFAGPVIVLVVIPIERMVRLLSMLMIDPLGYQSTRRYRRFVNEENEITKNTRWTKEVLKGMETSFLMSTILRIGSLMKVGFGSAGVEIIRRNLEKGQSKNMLMLNSQGSTVFCIFLFCDIRQFTDATECLQEEVFVFTNRIAAVVHSICHSYDGSANKNVGDAFLLSWTLEEQDPGAGSQKKFTARKNQADKALLSVVKICMALHHDDFYIETMTEGARNALLAKLSRRKGPVVQMGFGLHAGKAVQGAIGSQRKIDATYVSDAVERAEYLESATKRYGVKLLMSGSFHGLLHSSNRRRCRKVDQILLTNRDGDEDDEDIISDENTMELWTFDMDIEALWEQKMKTKDPNEEEVKSESGSERNGRREISSRVQSRRNPTKRLSFSGLRSEDFNETSAFATPTVPTTLDRSDSSPKLILPSGPALYNSNVWVSDEMRTIRQKYSDGLFFQKFNSGLQAFYSKDWQYAKQCFQTILERFEDGPSRYFLNQIARHEEKPPRDFLPYGKE